MKSMSGVTPSVRIKNDVTEKEQERLIQNDIVSMNHSVIIRKGLELVEQCATDIFKYRESYTVGLNYLDTNEQVRYVYYNSFRQLIGYEEDRSDLVKFLIEKDIMPKAYDGSNICSYGISLVDKTGYAWSHRGIVNLKIGDKVNKSSLAYIPDNVDELYDMVTSMFNNEFNSYRFIKNKYSVDLYTRILPILGADEDNNYLYGDTEEEYTNTFIIGQGEYIIKNNHELNQALIQCAKRLD